MHWAVQLIGAPWAPGAYGPDRFCCWGLVQWVYARQLGIVMPEIAIGVDEPSNVAAIRQVAVDARLQPAAPPPEREWDIVVMRGPHGRHVGVMVRTLRGLRLLHADGSLDEHGVAHGSVVAQPLGQLAGSGYGTVELWRPA